jgi:hypothetical protein
MNRAILLLPLLVLTACTSDTDLVRTGTFLYNATTMPAEKVPRDRAAAIPYATMGMELGSSAQALLILGTTTSDELDWFSGENIFVRTRRGHVIRTVGLPYDLGGLRAVMDAPSGAVRGGNDGTYSFDFPDLGVFGAIAQCSRRTAGDETIQIFGAPVATRHVVEHCDVPTMRWRFDNDFWEDRMSGYVWRSAQHIHPKAPVLTLEVFRPEQSAPS